MHVHIPYPYSLCMFISSMHGHILYAWSYSLCMVILHVHIPHACSYSMFILSMHVHILYAWHILYTCSYPLWSYPLCMFIFSMHDDLLLPDSWKEETFHWLFTGVTYRLTRSWWRLCHRGDLHRGARVAYWKDNEDALRHFTLKPSLHPWHHKRWNYRERVRVNVPL